MKKLISAVVAALAAMSLGASTASAELEPDPTSFHGVQESGTLSSPSGVWIQCSATVEGAIFAGGETGHITELVFTNCVMPPFPPLSCTLTVTPAELSWHEVSSNNAAGTAHLRIEELVEVVRTCPFVGTCHYNSDPADPIEGVFNEATHELVFTNQPLIGEGTGSCAGVSTWNAAFHLTSGGPFHVH